MRQLIPLIGNSQKLDGGAMFGHVPKAVWQKWMTPDENNRVSLACRALLVKDQGKLILLETGIGAFFEPALRDRYGVIETNHVLLASLAAIGLSHEDIDAVILSHLHFDHAGGLLSAWQPGVAPSLLFPKARYLVSQEAWLRALNPHVRDRASFIPQLTELLTASERLVLIDKETTPLLSNDYHFIFTNGHTPGLMHTIITTDEGPVIFASDLIPGRHWVHLPITMGYDRSAELLTEEKHAMLNFAVQQNARLFFTHDPEIAMGKVEQDTAGKFSTVEMLTT